MDDFEIDLGQYAGTDWERIASEELFKAAIRSQEGWRENLREGTGARGAHGAPYVDTGEAVNDITISPAAPGALEYVVGGDAVQLAVAEFGRAPGTPPPREAIAAWAHRKGLQPHDGESFDQMVTALCFAIAQHGLPAFAPAQLAHERVVADLEERIRARLRAEGLDESGVQD